MAKHRQKHLFPELDEITASILAGRSQDLVGLFVPSHDKNQETIPNQDQWATAALQLFAELYRGATGFETFAGVYRDSDGTILYDKPIMIQAYVNREDMVDTGKLKELLDFCKRMGRETDQAAVGLIVNHVFFEIRRFGKEST